MEAEGQPFLGDSGADGNGDPIIEALAVPPEGADQEGEQQLQNGTEGHDREPEHAAVPEADNGVPAVLEGAVAAAPDVDMEAEPAAPLPAPADAAADTPFALPPPDAGGAAADAAPAPLPADGAEAAPAAPADAPAGGATDAGPRKRRHVWGPPAKGEFLTLEELQAQKKKKKKSRWESTEDDMQLALVPVKNAASNALIIPGQIPKKVVVAGMEITLPGGTGGVGLGSRDPKVLALHEQLNDITRKLAVGDLDIPPEGDPRRSPSPEPVYDKSGVRLNTREIRARNKLNERRQQLMEDIIKSDPDYRPPADYKPRKFSSKIYIPINEYPGYNFIGLIIGPRGNTQKRMQTETNTKIAIRGKGSVKEGISRDVKYDYGEDEELHVLITGDNQQDGRGGAAGRAPESRALRAPLPP
ncbi:Splicing factor 1 [Monoraphidium neglectum]|uniref:Branchpoint-bridging protein n=1 Tax=Monoraphidium neglectum TaxID=145388 RepID=A0A0D2M2Q9_9CHLO|nr:Splicing factor 1 [Monoraphidium neglectum]KIY97919.1 Splicing factor 1 [Monoraphidium neglectum]|eukprot:XP_013896939.1 Splicing factor 1 [Monoraphidium neglectum]